MRKAANIVGVIAAVFTVMGAALKLGGIPGGGLLFVLFAGLFAGIAMPLYFVALSRENKSRILRVAHLATTLTGMHLIIGLLFFAQSWSGGILFFMQGSFLLLISLILHVLARKSEGASLKITSFTILFLIVAASLGLGWMCAGKRAVMGSELIETYRHEKQFCDSVLNTTHAMMDQCSADTTVPDSVQQRMQTFFKCSSELLAYLDEVEMEFVAQVNRGAITASKNELAYPTETDVPSWYFVGDNVQAPTGKGMDIYDHLIQYRQHCLHPGVGFFVPMNSTMEDKEQWTKDNFYHVPAAEAQTRLVMLRRNILQTITTSIDKKLFLE